MENGYWVRFLNIWWLAQTVFTIIVNYINAQAICEFEANNEEHDASKEDSNDCQGSSKGGHTRGWRRWR